LLVSLLKRKMAIRMIVLCFSFIGMTVSLQQVKIEKDEFQYQLEDDLDLSASSWGVQDIYLEILDLRSNYIDLTTRLLSVEKQNKQLRTENKETASKLVKLEKQLELVRLNKAGRSVKQESPVKISIFPWDWSKQHVKSNNQDYEEFKSSTVELIGEIFESDGILFNQQEKTSSDIGSLAEEVELQMNQVEGLVNVNELLEAGFNWVKEAVEEVNTKVVELFEKQEKNKLDISLITEQVEEEGKLRIQGLNDVQGRVVEELEGVRDRVDNVKVEIDKVKQDMDDNRQSTNTFIAVKFSEAEAKIKEVKDMVQDIKNILEEL